MYGAVVLASEAVALLIREGVLIPVTVFGGEPDDEDWGYGLCDRFTKIGSVGSDCNRARNYLFRPSDGTLEDGLVKGALTAILDEKFDVDA